MKAERTDLGAHTHQFLASFQLWKSDLLFLQLLLGKALAKAKAPPRPIDWEKVKEREEAFDRGETKLFSPSSQEAEAI